MQLNIYKNHDILSDQLADEMIQLVKHKPESVFCLASGDTPRLPYSMMTKKARGQKVDFSRCTFIGLDEWVGIPPENEGSCHYFLQKLISEPLHISADQIHLFDALSKDLANECRRMDKVVVEKGGIDMMIVGIGMNGHIGFNEPGVSVDHYAHVVDLDEATRTVGQKYFSRQTSLSKGITMGLKHLLEAEKVILLANGIKKAEVIRKALEEEITINLPASIIRKHTNSCVMLDEDAASALQK
jgi:glucosamine-6-phosphate isomerase